MRDIRELFPTDDPVSADLLIGRGSDVRDLATRLEDGTHMVIAGPRRTGKSTVGLAALERRPYSGTPSSSAKRALGMMERAGIAEHQGRGVWVIPEPLLRSYLAARP